MRTLVVAALCALTSTSCLMSRYLSQAADGQLHLLTNARPVDDVIADEAVAPRTRVLLAAIPEIKAYGAGHGLDTRHNYKTFVQLDDDNAVWFVGGSDPLAFKPTNYCFPIVGCFAGLGWFNEDDALADRARLEHQGFDAIARPAAAYSTGGWFPDPVLSSMLGDGDDAYPELANVILHESTHATVLVPDEPYFNESFAEYVGDTLTDEWIVEHFGNGSKEQVTWFVSQAIRRARTARMALAYRDLDAVYKSSISDKEKLAKKTAIIDALVAELHLVRRPNNASLVELRVYNAGGDGHERAHRACGSVTSLLAAAKTLKRSDFSKSLQDNLDPVDDLIAQRCAARANRAPH